MADRLGTPFLQKTLNQVYVYTNACIYICVCVCVFVWVGKYIYGKYFIL